MNTPLATMLELSLRAGVPSMLVTIDRARGSTPRDAGARILVTDDGLYGTIGGGRLEWEAAMEARRLLAAGASSGSLEVPLGPAIGQCCGGHVLLEFRRAGGRELELLRHDAAETAAAFPTVLLFGAGHVGKALARALAPLPLRVRWLDSRGAEFPDEVPDGIEAAVTGEVVAEIDALPRGAAVLAMTHSHAIDFEIVVAALAMDELAYVGVIGSASKRARFVQGLRALGMIPARIARLVCPIGATKLADKRPAVIAALVAVELTVTLAVQTASVLEEEAA